MWFSICGMTNDQKGLSASTYVEKKQQKLENSSLLIHFPRHAKQDWEKIVWQVWAVWLKARIEAIS